MSDLPYHYSPVITFWWLLSVIMDFKNLLYLVKSYFLPVVAGGSFNDNFDL